MLNCKLVLCLKVAKALENIAWKEINIQCSTCITVNPWQRKNYFCNFLLINIFRGKFQGGQISLFPCRICPRNVISNIWPKKNQPHYSSEPSSKASCEVIHCQPSYVIWYIASRKQALAEIRQPTPRFKHIIIKKNIQQLFYS